jgi:leucyl/phenylalanyl-tRNA--protein transferase
MAISQWPIPRPRRFYGTGPTQEQSCHLIISKSQKSLRRSIRKFEPHVSYNRAFLEVMRACGDRKEGNWMTEDFFEAYGALHRQGRAHSVEIWDPKEKMLVGGVYGVSFGAAFLPSQNSTVRPMRPKPRCTSSSSD